MYTGNLTNAGFYSIAEIPDSTKINTLVRSTLQLLSFATDHEHTGGNDGDLIPAAGIENNAIITDKIKDDNVTVGKLAHDINATTIGFDADKVDGIQEEDIELLARATAGATVETRALKVQLYNGTPSPLYNGMIWIDTSVS